MALQCPAKMGAPLRSSMQQAGRSPVAGLCRSATGLNRLESAASSMCLGAEQGRRPADDFEGLEVQQRASTAVSEASQGGPQALPPTRFEVKLNAKSCRSSQGIPSLLDAVAYVTDALHWRWGRRHAEGASCRRGAVNQGILTGTLDDDESGRAGERESGSPLILEILLRDC